jgi:hypothetical protein
MFNKLSSLFSKSTPEERFWNWFMKNEAKIREFINAGDNQKSNDIFRKLTNKVKRFSKDILPELTTTAKGKPVLVITADGIKDGIKPTQKLVKAAPDIEGWEIVKFRQPIDDFSIEIEDFKFPAEDIQVIPHIDRDEDVVDIELFIRNMNDDEELYKSMTFLYLDHTIGEFNTMTKVRAIDFKHLDEDQSLSNSISLTDLRKLIEKELY